MVNEGKYFPPIYFLSFDITLRVRSPFILLWGVFLHATVTQATEWVGIASSPNYKDMKLVTETETPFADQSFPLGGNTASRVAIVCSKYCASNASCQAFNLYTNKTHYICQYSLENFCTNRQRVALQAWQGSTVWDKVSPGMTQACIDQMFANSTAVNYCETGRSGCTGTWPSCSNCAQICANCIGTGFRNCTLWPEGPTERPIFGFCNSKATIIIKKQVTLSNGTIWPNYTMSFPDMHRLSNLSFYKNLKFQFNSTHQAKKYYATYRNFAIRPNGTLEGMKYVNSSTGGTNFLALKGITLKPAPFIYVQPNNDCGSFWLLNTTQNPGNMTCPGGRIGVFGLVNISANPQKTGISWPRVGGSDHGDLYYAEIRMDL